MLMMFFIFRNNKEIPQGKSDRFKSSEKQTTQNGNTGNMKASRGSSQEVHSIKKATEFLRGNLGKSIK